MGTIPVKTLEFMKGFSQYENTTLFDTIKYRPSNNFFNDEIGKKYLLYFLKSIDSELYLILLNMLNNNRIIFKDKFKVEESVCGTLINPGNNNVESTRIDIPHLINGMSILAAAHELGHGLRYDRRTGNSRLSVYNDIYAESVSILFGKLCEIRYASDFGWDDQVLAFEILNTNNAINCFNKLSEMIKKYENTLREHDKLKALKFPKNEDVWRNQKELRIDYANLYNSTSYPIGIALLNFYQKMSRDKQNEYLRLVVRFIISNTNIGIEDILYHFNPRIDIGFYQNNFAEYISDTEKHYQLGRGEK